MNPQSFEAGVAVPSGARRRPSDDLLAEPGGERTGRSAWCGRPLPGPAAVSCSPGFASRSLAVRVSCCHGLSSLDRAGVFGSIPARAAGIDGLRILVVRAQAAVTILVFRRPSRPSTREDLAGGGIAPPGPVRGWGPGGGEAGRIFFFKLPRITRRLPRAGVERSPASEYGHTRCARDWRTLECVQHAMVAGAAIVRAELGLTKEKTLWKADSSSPPSR